MITRMSELFLRTLARGPGGRRDPQPQAADPGRLYPPGRPWRVPQWLPLGWIVLSPRRERRCPRRDESNGRIPGGPLPALFPRAPYEASNRWVEYGDGMFRLKDRRGNDLLLAPTHEEMFTLLVKDLYPRPTGTCPFVIYQIQTKYHDEARPRAGPVAWSRVRDEGLLQLRSRRRRAPAVSYQRHRDTYHQDVRTVSASPSSSSRRCRERWVGRPTRGVPGPDPETARHVRALPELAATPPTWRPCASLR